MTRIAEKTAAPVETAAAQTPTIRPRRLTRVADKTAAAVTPTETAVLATATPTSLPGSAEALTPNPITSQILIHNAERRGAANVTITLYAQNGAVVHTETVRIKSNHTYLYKLPSNLGKDALMSARLESPKRIKAIVLDQSKKGKTRGAYEAIRTVSRSVRLPLVRHLAPTNQNSIIAVQNASPIAANATLTLYNENGDAVIAHPLSLPPFASAYVNTDDLIPGIRFFGSAEISASQPVAAAEINLYRRDTASFRGHTAEEEHRTLVFPLSQRKQKATGVWVAWSEFYIRNEGDQATDVKVEFYRPNGKLRETITRTNVPPNGLARMVLRSDEFASLGTKYKGWARIISGGAPLSVEVLSVQNRGTILSAVQGQPNTLAAPRAMCADFRYGPKTRSVLTILNLEKNKTAFIRARAFNGVDGKQVADIRFQVNPYARLSLARGRGPLAVIPETFNGILAVNTEGIGSKRIVVHSKTLALNANKRGISASAYICR